MFLCISIKSCNFDPVKIYAQKCLCRVRDHHKSKSVFPTDDSLFKKLYLAMMNITKKWTGRRQDWSVIYAQLTIFFGDRIPPNSRNRLARQGDLRTANAVPGRTAAQPPPLTCVPFFAYTVGMASGYGRLA